MSRCYNLMIGDSRDMCVIPDRSIDLVVTSPPYWAQVQYSDKQTDTLQGDISRIRNRKVFFREITKTWKECCRVLKHGGFLVCNWQDAFDAGYDYPREACVAGDMCKSIEESGLYLLSRWIWHKSQAGVAMGKAKYSLYGNLEEADPRAVGNWEYVFAFKKYGGRGEFRPKRKLDFTRDEWKVWNSGVWYIEAARQSDLIGEIPGGAVYPVELPKRIIKIYTEPEQVVLDPFLGTGTTMLAAFKTRRSCIGFEVRSEMIEVIKRKVGWGQVDLTGDEAKWAVVKLTEK